MTDNSHPLFTEGSKHRIISGRLSYGNSAFIRSLISLSLVTLLTQISDYITSGGMLFLLIAAAIFIPFILHAILIVRTKLGYAVFHNNSADITVGSHTHNLIYGSEIELKLTAHKTIGGTIIYYTAAIVYDQNGVKKRISMLTDLPDHFTAFGKLFRTKGSDVNNSLNIAAATAESENKRVVISPPFKALTKGAKVLSAFFNILAGALFALIVLVYASMFAYGSESFSNAENIIVFVIVILIFLAAAFLIRLPAGIHYRRVKSKTAREIVIADDLLLSGISVNGKAFPKEGISEIYVTRAISSGRLYLTIKAGGVQHKWLLGYYNSGDSKQFNDLSALCGDNNSRSAVKKLLGIDVLLKQI